MIKLHLILDVLLNNQQIFESLNTRYPNLSNDLNSAKENSQCHCRRRVIEFIQEKYDTDPEEKEYIDNLINSQDFVKKNIDFIIQDHDRINNALGKVYKIEKTDNYYAKFLDELKEKNLHHFIRSLSIVDKGEYIEVYLLGWKF